ncbi:hypothetical protein Snas_0435 [Stackebrandtia nassauensis DSM 44728]|uniref:Uncharacterized protein n=1 Tax=Stackebrandtia nassauensis (strain DSM 44728 / CIP 108903 / NRRL B-16338 / NBRC 102104 / LLR-40K-21) TaxID=446470 RepID=D3Q4J0_STANL|nr:hypothetical protein Snas_0435 [Stackebrandtia nassauensis DSM 44728]
MTKTTVRQLAERMAELGMITRDAAEAALAHIGRWRLEALDEIVDADELIDYLPEFGVAISVHGEDVDHVEDYYQSILESDVTACTGGAVTVTDVTLVRVGEDTEWLYFLRNGEPVWWYVEHQSDDYVDQLSVSEQFEDLYPGGDDPRGFLLVHRSKAEACQDDVYVLATIEQATALRDEFGIDFLVLHRRQLPVQDTREAGDFLEHWTSNMDELLHSWRSRFLPPGFPFDFSVASLDTLERLVLNRFADWDAVQRAAADPFVVGAVGYLGETLLRAAPGSWDYWTGASVYDRTPLLRSNTPKAFGTTVVPLVLLSRVAGDRDFGILAEAVEDLLRAEASYAEALRALDTAPAAEDDEDF